MSGHWHDRWERGRIGWHETHGNVLLRQCWPELRAGSRVLVPLCGKAFDLKWLADRGLEVHGVELSEIAIRAFFAENDLEYRFDNNAGLPAFAAIDQPITLHCGDIFDFIDRPFDAHFDRGALVALPRRTRPAYVRHMDGLLQAGAFRLLITLEYDQSRVEGPPYAVMADEVASYWPGLAREREALDTENFPPKFRAAGLQAITEVAWRTA